MKVVQTFGCIRQDCAFGETIPLNTGELHSPFLNDWLDT